MKKSMKEQLLPMLYLRLLNTKWWQFLRRKRLIRLIREVEDKMWDSHEKGKPKCEKCGSVRLRNSLRNKRVYCLDCKHAKPAHPVQ